MKVKSGPLSGVTVVDVGWGAPASIMSMLFADNGATVIKVERKGEVDAPDDLKRLAWERGKASIALDLALARDRAVLDGLLAKADIFCESFGAGRAARFGLDYASLSARFPRLICCAISAYGQDGPWRDEPGYDCLVAAKLGLMAEQAAVEREGPIYLGHPNIAYGTGFLGAIASLAALQGRHATGRGQFVDVSLLDAVLVQSPMNHWWHPNGLSYVETSGGKRVGFGYKRLITAAFECEDGEFIQIHTGGQGGFKSVMEIFGFGDIAQTITSGSDMSVPLSEEEYTIAREYIPTAFQQKPRAEWLPLFQARDVAVLPVLRQGEVLHDDQVRFADRAMPVAHPTRGELLQAAPPLIFGKSRAERPAPAPARDIDAAEIRALAAAPAPAAASPGHPGSIAHPLQRIRILDFSTFFATGYGAKLMSDLGADVIIVEPPGGDQLRPLPNPFEAAHRGKRNIILNLKTAEGQAVAHDLARTADVVMHNQRPGKADKIGIGYEALAAINPSLIYCYLPGFGSGGPRANNKSFAPLQSGLCGLLYEGAGQGNPPVRSIEGNEDYYNGLMGAVAVLSALQHRARTGEGQYVECPQLHSTMFVGSHHFLGAGGQSLTALPMDRGQFGLGPLYRLYPTADDWICIACVGRRAVAGLAEALDVPAGLLLPADGAALTPEASDALAAAIGERLGRLSAEDAKARLRAKGVACEIPAKAPQTPNLFWDDWAFATGRVVEQAESMHGHIREIGLCMRLSDTPGVHKGPAPRVGQHTAELLAGLGYDAARIAALARAGAIYCEPTLEGVTA